MGTFEFPETCCLSFGESTRAATRAIMRSVAGSIASSPECPRFTVRTLGFPEIQRDDRPLPLALRKGLALLVHLAEAGGPAGRDAIATMLWPESSEDVVRARLRRLLHRLQGALGD